MGCIWATYGDLFCNIWSFFNIWWRKSFRKHNIWATYGSLFQTYGVLLKHIGPFWNIWGLSETYGAFRERSSFLFPTCHIALFRYMSFFFLKVLPITNQACSRYFCRRKTSVGSFRESLKPVFYHQSWNRKATAKISSWSCDCVSARSYAYYADDAPTVAWTLSSSLSSAAAAWRARACGSSKCPPPAKIEAGEPRRNLWSVGQVWKGDGLVPREGTKVWHFQPFL